MAKRGVRRKVLLQDPVPARTEEIPRHVRLLALAHRWHRLIDSGEIRDQAAIARATGLTRARVTQIMSLRWIHPLSQQRLVVRTSDAPSAAPPPPHSLITPYWPHQRRPVRNQSQPAT